MRFERAPAYCSVLINDYQSSFHVIKVSINLPISYEKVMVNGKPINYVVGYATVYRYYAHPFKLRPRISQFLILQPWQRKGLGVKLLTAINEDLRKDPDVLDIVGEAIISAV